MPHEPPPARCEALTLAGTPCGRDDARHVAIDGSSRWLCGPHTRMARRGPIALWTVPGSETTVPPRGTVPWTAAEDTYLVANPEATPAEAARRLARSEWLVRRRRVALWRERRATRDLLTGSE